MFQVTEDAKAELQTRLQAAEQGKYIRLRMRDSCMLKVKLTLEDERQPNDELFDNGGMQFIIPKEQIHFFRGKKLDYAADRTGFKEFDVT